MRALLMFALLVNLLAYCAAAGINTHTYVGYRTANFYGHIPASASPNSTRYNEAIQKNLLSVLGGADFPDFGYACGKDHDAGEAAHWPGWHEAAVKYIRQKEDFISGNWSDDTEKLIAFVFGASIHYIADEFFEGLTGELGRGQGLVEQLGAFNLNNTGKGDVSENTANIGGDFFVAWSFDEKRIRPWERYFPTEEIVAIYKMYNNPQFPKGFADVTVAQMNECKILFDLGGWAEKSFGPILLQQVTKDTPFLGERYQDLPIGGVDDMAVWASFEWQRLAKWLDVGPPSPAEKEDDSPDASERWVQVLSAKLRPLRTHAELLLAIEVGELQRRISLVEPLAPWAGIRIDVSDVSGENNRGSAGNVYTPAVMRLLGKAMQAVMEAVEEVMGTSLEGRDRLQANGQLSYAAVGRRKVPTTATAAAAVAPTSSIPGGQQVGYLGHALAAADFDGDGVLDLAAGAYGACGRNSSNQLPCDRPQQGQVEVRYAMAKQQSQGQQSGRQSPQSPQVIAGPEMVHSRYGWAIATLDFNRDGFDDLVVSAPFASDRDPTSADDAPVPYNATPAPRYQGRVYVHYGSKQGLSSAPDVTIATADDLTMLGLTLRTADVDGDGQADLLVGGPQSSFTQSIPDARAAADLVLDGPACYDWFGQDMAVVAVASPASTAAAGGAAAASAQRLLLVGAPGHRNSENGTVGRVYAYDLEGLNSSSGKPLFSLTGAEHPAEFGWSLATTTAATATATTTATASTTATALLAIASPAGGPRELTNLTAHQNFRGGRVKVVRLTPELVQEVRASVGSDIVETELEAQAVLLGMDLGRLGSFLEFSSPAGGDLLLGAPMASPEALKSVSLIGPRNAGAFYVIPQQKATGIVKDVSKIASYSLAGKRPRGRLGTAAAVLHTATNITFVVSSPFADTTSSSGDVEMGGVLDIISI